VSYLKVIISISFVAFAFAEGFAQNSSKFSVDSAIYDSLLYSDFQDIDRLFYKHISNIHINNTGTFGSMNYVPHAKHLYSAVVFNKRESLNDFYFDLNGVKPLSKITYVNASRKEQIFELTHLQKFGHQISLALNLYKSSSPGAYINQEANNTFFDGVLTYETKGKSYLVSLGVKIQRDFLEENGGIMSVDDFEDRRYDNERAYPVNLSSSNSYIKRYLFELAQDFRLLSFGSDTINSNIYVSHKISYQDKQRLFFDNDPTSSIYQTSYLDSNRILSLLNLDSIGSASDSSKFDYLNGLNFQSSLDSMFNSTLTNKVSLGWRKEGVRIELFGQQDRQDYFQGLEVDTINRYVDTSYNDLFAGISSEFNFNGNKLDFLFRYGIDGYRKDDITMVTRFHRKFRHADIGLTGGYTFTEASLKQRQYISNHFVWDNKFEKQAVLYLGLSFAVPKYQLSFEAETKSIENALYYDTSALASQFYETISMTSLSLEKRYKVLNFHFRTAGIYQMTSNNSLLPLPEIIARQIIYYQKMIFKGALKMQFGIGFSYSTEYLGYNYMPATSEFYIQESQNLGYYPNIDVFLNTHLKRAQIFLKYEHVNAGGSSEKAYLVPGYPQLNKSLKFGVSWNLFD
jgi:hypothetical protein